MAKKRLYLFIALIILIISGYFVVAEAFPKELSRYPIFVLGLILDVYLWVSILRWIRSWRRWIRYIFSALYWMPFLLMITIGIASLFMNIYLWKPHLATYVGGSIFTIYIAKLFTIIFFFLADLIKIIRHSLRFAYHKKTKKPCPERGQQISRASFLQKLGLIGGGLVLSGLVIGAVRWAYDFRVRRVRVRFPMLPEQLEGLKILQISDLHLGSWSSESAMKEAVDLMNDENADLVFFTGDLVNFHTKEAYTYQHLLKNLKSRYGVYAVLGNHDYGDYLKWESKDQKDQNLADLIHLYRQMGWKLLMNENEILLINGVPIAIAGVENWSAYDRFPRYGDLDKALAGTEDAGFKILLSHDPTHWDKIVSSKRPDVHLTFSGHTHGFQFGVEMKNFRWSPAQYMYKQWAGLYSNPYTDTPQYVYVNRGLGMIGYPGRIGILPEIAVIELTSEA